jgi:lipopolysaccharide/colanic/teichoic acid biosynthesis glycosyltransferase
MSVQETVVDMAASPADVALVRPVPSASSCATDTILGGGLGAADQAGRQWNHLLAHEQIAGLPNRATRYGPGGLCARLAYRAFEILAASIALVLAIPLLLVVGAIIKAGTRGPMLFWQQRMGANCKPFAFVKFRTMYHDARTRHPELYAYRYDARQLKTLHFKIEDDPRVTPQGRWLRKSTLDELPNFWNVITGSMALVGPRPEIPEMLPYYSGEMLAKFSVRPGITGLAQISGRGRLGFHETVALDVTYVRHQSIWLDMRILLKTVLMVVLRDGAF